MLKKEMDECRDASQINLFGAFGKITSFKHNKSVLKWVDFFHSKYTILNVDKNDVLCDAIDLKYPSDHLPVYVEINFK